MIGESEAEEEVVEEESDRVPIDPSVTSPAEAMLVDLFREPIGDLSEPIVDIQGTPNNALNWVCRYTPEPAPALGASAVHSSERASVTLHAFGAGQGKYALRNAQQQVASCDNRQGNAGINSSASPASSYDGFSAYLSTNSNNSIVGFFAIGDVLVSVSAPSSSAVNRISNAYASALNDHMTPICESLTYDVSDSVRSPYYNLEDYVGWERGREVDIDFLTAPELVPGVISDSDVSGQSLPVGHFPSDSPILANFEQGEALGEDTFSMPSRPLPPVPVDIEQEAPELVSMPSRPSEPATQTVIPERVEDPVGPGCGWAFVGQSAPVWDATEERERVDAAEAETRAELREDYRSYLQRYLSYPYNYAEYALSVEEHNDYISHLREVAQEWDRINAVRAEYRALLDEYWELVEQREDFIARQEAAQEEYDEDVAICEAREEELEEQLEEQRRQAEEEAEEQRRQEEEEESDSEEDNGDESTEDEESEESEEPEPEPIEEIELDCMPDRPSILDEQVPPMPTPPTEPTDVPLPDQWTDIP